jgi:hypothetical protein
MHAGLTPSLMLDVAAAQQAADRRRGARDRAQLAEVRRGRASHRLAPRAR